MRAVIAAAVLLFTTAESFAQPGVPAPCQAYWNGGAVFVAKVIAQDRTGIFHELHVEVLESFKGVSAGSQLTLRVFRDFNIDMEDGAALFVYASRQADGALQSGRPRPLAGAAADLAYARSAAGHRSSGFVSGQVRSYPEDRNPERAISGVTVRVVGENFTGETTSDHAGTYSIALPHAGAYEIEVVPPPGYADRWPGQRFEIADPRACHHQPVTLISNGRITGRVVDRDGQPIPDLVVSTGSMTPTTKTDATGSFELGPLGEDDHEVNALTGSVVPLSAPVKVNRGRVTELESMIMAADDLVSLLIAVDSSNAGTLFLSIDNPTDAGINYTLPANATRVRLQVQKDKTFTVRASSSTHEAQTIVRTSAPETVVTLMPQPRKR